jgi:23S rRNA pseudouridine1911/1915/1917 synthase
MKEIKVNENDENKRLDIFLSNYLNETRSLITKHIKLGDILLNGKKVKPGEVLKKEDIITINSLKSANRVIPSNIKLDILYEDNDIIVVNKKSGMVVHPAAGNYENTLMNALLNHTNKLSDVNGNLRLGIVHRIDKDTSGILVVAKNNKAHNILAASFKNKTIKRKYIALVSKVIEEDNGRIDAPIGRSKKDRKKMEVTDVNAKKAVTNFKVLERYKNATLIECILETGRTHQIRVHMAYINHPIINDKVYSNNIINDYGQMLHAYYLGFNHPITNEFMEFNCPFEEEFINILNMFKD